MKLGLCKKQKLCGEIAIAKLFSHDGASRAALAFPLRAVWRENPGRRSDAPIRFLISVPKRKLHRAVDRMKMRRRIREAFRLNHQNYPLPDGARLDVAFVYLDSALLPYDRIDRAMKRLLEAISTPTS